MWPTASHLSRLVGPLARRPDRSAHPGGCGAEIFIDVPDVQRDEDAGLKVFDVLRDCRELVVLLTPWPVARNWVGVEIGAARAFDQKVTALLYGLTLDEIDRNHEGRTFLRLHSAIDLNESDQFFAASKRRVAGAEERGTGAAAEGSLRDSDMARSE